MFGFIADGLTVALTVLFPVFASYKALHTSDPAVLAPWLIYFMVLMLFHTIENTFDFILSWVPFYSWLRLFLHVYLIMPGSQGATYLYTEHIEPLLYHHEREIDDFITDTHSKAKAAGLIYAEKAVEWIKVNVLGFAPKKPDTPPAIGQTYAQNFMSRFAMPSARGGDNFTNLLSQALSGAGAMYAGNQGAQASELSRGSTLIPESIRNNDDRMSYVASQRQRLETLMQAFDREQDNLRTARDSGSRYYEGGSSGGPGLSRNRSEGEFDRIERDEIGSDRPPYPTTPPALGRRTSSGWMPWNWRQGQPIPDDPLAYGKDHSQSSSSQGRSTGYDGGR